MTSEVVRRVWVEQARPFPRVVDVDTEENLSNRIPVTYAGRFAAASVGEEIEVDGFALKDGRPYLDPLSEEVQREKLHLLVLGVIPKPSGVVFHGIASAEDLANQFLGVVRRDVGEGGNG